MNIHITVKNIELTDAIKSYVEKKVAKVKRYFDQVIDVNVVLDVHKNVHLAEVLVNAKGVFLKGAEKSEDLYASIDLAVDKIDRQLVKYKSKLKNKKLIDKKFEQPLRLDVYNVDSLDADDPVSIITKDIPVKPMDVEEAVMQMDLLNKNFFVFRNAKSSEVNVVYKRDDGNIGLITP